MADDCITVLEGSLLTGAHVFFLFDALIVLPVIPRSECSAHCICCALFVFDKNSLKLRFKEVIGIEQVPSQNISWIASIP